MTLSYRLPARGARAAILPCAVIAICFGGYLGAPAAQAQVPSTDVYLLRLEQSAPTWRFAAPENLSARAGYDNQPAFLVDGSAILYTSQRGEQTDIYRYDLASGETRQLTDTAESEYSPTPFADDEAFSVIRVEADGTQRLWRFAMDGDQPQLLLPDIAPVGYHRWIDDEQLLLFVLGDPPTLERATVGPGGGERLASSIGRAFGTIPTVDESNDGRLSFIHKRAEHDWWVVAIHPKTGERTPLVKLRPNREDVAWSPDGSLFSGDGSRLFRWHPASPERGWVEVANLAEHGIRGITRLAWSPDGRALALVATHRPTSP